MTIGKDCGLPDSGIPYGVKILSLKVAEKACLGVEEGGRGTGEDDVLGLFLEIVQDRCAR